MTTETTTVYALKLAPYPGDNATRWLMRNEFDRFEDSAEQIARRLITLNHSKSVDTDADEIRDAVEDWRADSPNDPYAAEMEAYAEELDEGKIVAVIDGEGYGDWPSVIAELEAGSQLVKVETQRTNGEHNAMETTEQKQQQMVARLASEVENKFTAALAAWQEAEVAFRLCPCPMIGHSFTDAEMVEMRIDQEQAHARVEKARLSILESVQSIVFRSFLSQEEQLFVRQLCMDGSGFGERRERAEKHLVTR